VKERSDSDARRSAKDVQDLKQPELDEEEGKEQEGVVGEEVDRGRKRKTYPPSP
jgi:hypothetical protein